MWWDGLKTDEAVKGHLHFTRDLVWLRRRHPALRGELGSPCPNVSRKLPLFASLGAAVCGLLQLAYVYVSDVMINTEVVR